jgi:hypothetical protein
MLCMQPLASSLALISLALNVLLMSHNATAYRSVLTASMSEIDHPSSDYGMDSKPGHRPLGYPRSLSR